MLWAIFHTFLMLSALYIFDFFFWVIFFYSKFFIFWIFSNLFILFFSCDHEFKKYIYNIYCKKFIIICNYKLLLHYSWYINCSKLRILFILFFQSLNSQVHLKSISKFFGKTIFDIQFHNNFSNDFNEYLSIYGLFFMMNLAKENKK